MTDSTNRGAGMMFLTPEGLCLFLKRSADSLHPGTWNLPGGHAKDGEGAEDAAIREASEEVGARPYGERKLINSVKTERGFQFDTFQQLVRHKFEPKLNEEHTEYQWLPLSEAPQPLHPGLAGTLTKLAMDAGEKHDPSNGQFTSGGGSSGGGESGKKKSKATPKDFSMTSAEAHARYPEKSKDLQLLSKVGESIELPDHEGGGKTLLHKTRQGFRQTHYPAPTKKDGANDSRLAFDRQSVRTLDADGRMHIEITNISKACVNPYLGKEILAGATDIKGIDPNTMDPDKIYYLLRDPEELAKAASTFNNIPLLNDHIAFTVDEPPQDAIVGSSGTDCVFEAPYLRNSLVIWTKDAITGVEDQTQQEISCSYRYVADMTPGSYEGRRYDGVMREIHGNHIALVADGRAGPDVVVGDSVANLKESFTMKHALSKKAVLAKGALLALLVPKLAADAMPDLNAIMVGVNRKNWLDKKPGIIAAIKVKLAKDADLQDVVALLDKLDGQEGGVTADEDEAVAVDSPNDQVLSLLRGKINDEDMAAVTKLLSAPTAADDDKVDTDRLDANNGGKTVTDVPTKDNIAADAKDDDKKDDDKPVPKAAMDAAIKAAVDGVQKDSKLAMDKAVKAAEEATIKRLRAVSEAEEVVKPYVGKLAVACDSAEAVFKAALEAMEVDVKDLHPSAYRAVLEAQPRPGSELHLAHDSVVGLKTGKEFDTKFPNARRLG